MSREVIKVGVVGLGRSGWDLHVASLRQDPRYRIVAVCDSLEARRDQAEAELACTAYSEFQDFLSRGDCDLVVIAAPTRDHAWMTRAALGSHADVVLEKPLATTFEEATDLGEVAARLGRRIAPYYNYRFSNDFLLIRSILEGGRIGDPFLIRRHVSYFNRRDDWQSRRDQAGGILNAATIHFVDQVMQLAGNSPSEVWSDVRTLVSPGDAADHSKVVLRFQGGLVGDVEVSWAIGLPDLEWMICGPRGAIRSDGGSLRVRWFDEDEILMGPEPDRSYYSAEKIHWHEETHTTPDGFSTGYYDTLAGALQEGQALPVSWQSALETFRVMERCAAASPAMKKS